MPRLSVFVLIGLIAVAFSTAANAACPTYHSLSNGTAADATQVMDNFNYILNCPGFTGPVGIGTSSPNALLDLTGNTTTGGTADAIRLTDLADVTTSRNWLIGNGAGPNYGDLAFLVSNSKGGAPTGAPVLNLASNGNIGIGVGTPVARLDLTGSTTTSGTADAIRFSDLADVTTSRNWLVGNGAGPNYGDFSFLVSATAGTNPTGTPILNLSSSGNVGVGTASPIEKLYVAGNIYATGNVTCGGTCGGAGYWALSGSSLTASSTSYNVGIGTTSPSSKLDVNGATNITGTLNVTGAVTCGSGCTSGPWSVSGSAIVPSSTSYNLGIGTTTPLAQLDVYGAGTNGIRVLSGGSTSSTSFVIGRTASEGYLAIVGAANQWALGTAAGDLVLTNPASGKLLLSSQASSATPELTVKTGKVGIGTVNPSQTLDVAGSLNVSGAITCGSGCAGGPWSVSGSNIIPASNSYFVGIGTSTPMSGFAGSGGALDVESGSLNGGTIAIFGTSVTGSNSAGIRLTSTGTTEMWLGTAGFGLSLPSPTQSDIGLSARGRLAFDSGGPLLLALGGSSVGIGTTSPSGMLTVGGGSAALNADVLVNGGTNSGAGAQITVQRGGTSKGSLGTHSRIYGGTSDALALVAASGNNLEFAAGGASPQLSINSSGAVGIGASPITGISLSIGPNASSHGILAISNTSGYISIIGRATVSGAYSGAFDSNGASGSCALQYGATSWACTSDARLKTNIVNITGADALAKLATLSGVTFNWKTGATANEQMGVVAQAVQKVFPDAVSADPKGYLAVQYDSLIAPLISAVNALNQRTSHDPSTAALLSAVSDLKAANDRQAAEIAELETKVSALQRKFGTQIAIK